jgi:8-oxo-dGTP pyrophosphatase MutT (NUDIX family)
LIQSKQADSSGRLTNPRTAAIDDSDNGVDVVDDRLPSDELPDLCFCLARRARNLVVTMYEEKEQARSLANSGRTHRRTRIFTSRYVYGLTDCFSVSFVLWLTGNIHRIVGSLDHFVCRPAAEATPDRVAQLLLASKLGAARELFEETGIDVRSELDRLLPPFLHPQTNEAMPNESDHRIYYFLIVTDDDFPKIQLAPPSAPLTAPMRPDGNSGQQRRLLEVDDSPTRHVRLRLSHEHSGFTFQVDTAQAAIDIQYHSGGKNSVALRKALQIAEPPPTPATQRPTDETPHNNESSTTTENQQPPEQSDAVADETTLLAGRNQSVPDICAKLRSCCRRC